MIEEFFKTYQHTIAAIAAAGTLLAVVTSLVLAWSAKRADRTRLKAHADIVLILEVPYLTSDHFNEGGSPIDEKNTPKFLKMSITNIGRFPLHISSAFFYWKVPFSGEVMQVMPHDFIGSALVQPKHYPIEISPRASESFTISDVASLEREAKRMRGADTFADRVRFRFIRAFVRTDDGETFRVKLSSGIRQVWSGS